VNALGYFWFDVRHGFPVAARVLHRELGAWRTARVLAGVLRRTLLRDPFRRLGRVAPGDGGEWASRRQLGQVLAVEGALREGLGLSAARVLELVGQVVGQSGARFVAVNVGSLTRPRWEAMSGTERRGYVEGVIASFPNAIGEVVDDPRVAVAFDISACRIAELCREIGRPELGPLFCAADRVYYDDPQVPIELERAGTIAEGHDRCPFRLRFSS